MLYLQAEGLGDNLWWVLGAAIVLVIVYFITRKAEADQDKRDTTTNDPYQNVVNDSSYNINQEGIDGHRDEGATAAEARRAPEQMDESGHIPSDEEFHELRKDMKKDRE